MPTWTPLLALLGSLLSLCLGTSYAKHLFSQLGAEGVSALRIGLSACLLMIFLRPWRQSWKWRDWGPLAAFGGILGLMNLLFYESIARIPLGVAIAIEFTGPLTVAILHSRKALDWVWVGLVVTGLALLLPLPGADDIARLDAAGVGFALLAAVCWALYIVQGKRVAQRHGVDSIAVGMAFAACLVVPVGLFESRVFILQPQWWWPGLMVALFSSALPYGLEMFALKHLPRHTFSICLSLEPVIGAATAWWLLGEALTPPQWLAIGFIMLASVGSAWAGARMPPN
jgi:inner membrane transporter RhtA